MYSQCFKLFCRAAQRRALEENESKQLLSSSLKAECASAVVASTSRRASCSEDTAADSARGVAYGEVNVPTNGHTECVAT